MAKVYLFRKLPELNQQQSDVCNEAISSALNDVLKGGTSTIYNYGNWPDYMATGDASNKPDMIERILNDLFSQVYTMGVNMEINISIRHVQLNVEDSQQKSVNLLATKSVANECNKQAREHFVATSKEVFSYINKYTKQKLEQKNNSNAYVYNNFILCVRQSNLQRSIHLNGKLQIVLLTSTEYQNCVQLATPMGNLLKVISALATNKKTHLRYHNIRLTQILKNLLGPAESSVIINYTADINPEAQVNIYSTQSCAKIWKALYLRERKRCECLNDKIFCLEFWSSSGQKLKLEELMELLKKSNADWQLELEIKSNQAVNKNKDDNPELNHILKQLQQKFVTYNKQLVKEQNQLYEKMKQTKLDAEVNYDEMLELQRMVAGLAFNFEQNVQQLAEKNRKLTKLQTLLAKANKKVQRQRNVFQRKLAMYSEMFKKLWRHQSNVLQIKEQQREEQLSEMFNAICNELHSTHQKH